MGNTASSRWFYELRALSSLALLIFTLYKCRFIDSFFKYMVRLDMERVTKLPVTIGSLTSSFSAGFVIIENIRIHAPPVEIDDRWHIETMVSVACLYIEVPMFMALFFQIVSVSQLMVCDSIHVTGLKFFAEGHMGPNDTMQYNLDLIGGKRDSTVVDHRNKIKQELEAIKLERKRQQEEAKRLKKEQRSAGRRPSPTTSSSPSELEPLSYRSTGLNELGSGLASNTPLTGGGGSTTEGQTSSASLRSASCDSYDLNFVKSVSSTSLNRRPSYSAHPPASEPHSVLPGNIVIPADVVYSPRELAPSESCVTLLSVPSVDHLRLSESLTDSVLVNGEECSSAPSTASGESTVFVHSRTPSGKETCEGALLKTTVVAASAVVASSAAVEPAATEPALGKSKSSGMFSFNKFIRKATVAFQEVQQDVANHNEKMDQFIKSKVAEITNTVNEWKSDMDDFNAQVTQKGLLGVASEKITEAVQKAKQSIEDSIDDNIIAMHVKQNGLEPEVDPEEPRLICRKMVFDTIEVFLYRTLPVQLRHLEKKPLVIQSLVMTHLGYDGLLFNDRRPLVTPPPSSDQLSSAASADGDDEEDLEILDAWNTIRKHSQLVRSRSGALAKPQYREGVKSETPVSSATSGSSGVSSSEKTDREERKPQAVPSRKGMASEDPRIHDVRMRSIDVNKSGLDINILKYRFERLMLLDICKSNGGRLLMDVFDMTAWNTTPSYSNFSYVVNKNVVKKSTPSGSAPSSASATPVKGGTSRSIDGVVEIHPIFFGEDD